MARPSTLRLKDLPVTYPLYRQSDKRDQVDSILRQHDYGDFSRSAGLVDELMTDDRILGVTSTRAGGILAAPLEVKPATDKRKATKIADILGGCEDIKGVWRDIAPASTLRELWMWGWYLGVGVARQVWTRTAREWRPRLVPWHPQFLRWDWNLDRFVMRVGGSRGEVPLPRPDEQPNGDGEWFVWCPYGVKYGWRRSLLRSLADRYLARQWNYRDWSRYCEKHGLGIIEARVPAGASQEDKDSYLLGVSQIGSDGTVMTPQGAQGEASFGVSIVEATAQTWQAFQAFKQALDVDIAIAVLGQNLTTEVQGGSYAAAKVQNLVRIDKATEDAEMGPALKRQVVSWWTDYNHGDASLTPDLEFQVDPPEDEKAETDALASLGTAILSLEAAGVPIDKIAIANRYGLPLLPPVEGEADGIGTTDKPIELTPTAFGIIIKVNEARAQIGLPPLQSAGGVLDPDGDLTIAEYQAKHAHVVAQAANAVAGDAGAPADATSSGTDQTAAAPDQAALRRSVAKLRTVAGAKRAATYMELLEANAKKRAAAKLRPDLEAIMEEVKAATSYDDLRKRVIKRFRGMDPTGLADIVRKARIMAHLSGRGSALEEV